MAELQRRFLFLQGLPGKSFLRLAQALQARGYGVSRVNFNGGDQLDWRGPAIDYRGAPAAWPDAFRSILTNDGISDIVLFGDCRPLHQAASCVAKSLGIAVHVFEEGYIRPDWVTLEYGGVNGYSSLPRDPDWYRAAALGLPEAPTAPALSQTFGRRARETFAYYAALILLGWRYPHYRTHRPTGTLTEGLGWVRRFLNQYISHKRSEQALRGLRGLPYFLFAMQLDSDSQIRVHSTFAGMAPALEQVIVSFAKTAGPKKQLLIKEHPLDNGLVNWRGLVTRLAAEHQVSDRVAYCNVGDIDALVRGSEGLLTVNSTTAALALAAGVPVMALGEAVYNLPGLTHQKDLKRFWIRAQKPSLDLYDAFRRVLVDRCLVRGGFYSEDGLNLLISGAVERMASPPALATHRTVAA